MAAIIPITLAPSSIFDISLDDGNFLIQTYWMSLSQTWMVDITKDGQTLINGLRLVLGTDLVGQYNLNVGVWVMVDLTNTGNDATRNNLGVDLVLFYIPESERKQLDV